MKKRALVVYDGALASVVARHDDRHALAAHADAMGDAGPVTAALVDAGFDARAAALSRDPARILDALRDARPDVVVNLCDTLDGKGEHALVVPALLEATGLPFAGAPTSALALSKRKHDVKAVLSRDALPTPRYQVVRDVAELDEPGAFSLRVEPPVIVKLTGEHASIGLEQASVCFDVDEARARCRSMLERHAQPLLLEEYVDGRELSVSFYGDPLRALPPMEHPFDHVPEGFLRMRTFDMKWTDTPALSDRTRNADAATREDRTHRDVPLRRPVVDVGWSLAGLVEACARAFLAVGCRDWGRVDVRVDKGGVPLIIDVTPNTYLGPTSPCAKAALVSGVSFTDFVAAIAEGALRRRTRA